MKPMISYRSLLLSTIVLNDIYIYIYIYMYVRMYVCKYVCKYVCMYVYICIIYTVGIKKFTYCSCSTTVIQLRYA